jgi:DNA-binding XRE family transcriptional regulator
VIVDLERRQVVDVLTDRSADSTAEWLRANPEVEMVSRDRAGLYADGAWRGALQARQIAEQSMPTGRQPDGEHALSDADRQARYRSRREAEQPLPKIRYCWPADRRTRAQRWHDNVTGLVALQAECVAWHDGLPDGLRDSATAEALQAIVDHDLDALTAIVPPRGYASLPRGTWLNAAVASQYGIDTTMAKRAPDRQTDEAAPGADLQILFGENFKAARLKAGLSQGDVVALSGLKQQTISQIEAVQHNLTLKTMDKLAKAVGRTAARSGPSAWCDVRTGSCDPVDARRK